MQIRHNPSRRRTLVGLAGTGLAACTPFKSGEAAARAPILGAAEWAHGVDLPEPVQEIYPCAHRGRIHLAGGFVARDDAITGPTARHWSWQPGTAAWQQEVPLPVPRHHSQLISFKNQLWALGGFESPSADSVWVMQPGSWFLDGDTWRDGPALPRPNGESVSAVIAERLHICGGRQPFGAGNSRWQDHTDTSDHFVLDAPDATWTRAAPLPTPRNSAAAAMIDGLWHVVGGRTVAAGNTGAHNVFDPAEDRWRPAAPMPQGQAGLAAAVLGGCLYAFGGEFFDGEGGVFAETWIYDPSTDEWTAGPPMPTPRHGIGAAVIDEVAHVLGGAEQVGGSQTSAAVETLSLR
ncbi:MAG: kelch repeat-containing protein [Pseudomonadota bacterium]